MKLVASIGARESSSTTPTGMPRNAERERFESPNKDLVVVEASSVGDEGST